MTKWPNRKLVAICGGLRSGKDTIGTYLCAYYGFSREAFGDSMKQKAHEIFPHIPQKPKPVTMYVDFGEAMRKIYPKVWVDFVDRRFNDPFLDFYYGDNVVITDLRNPLEYEWCRDNGFTVIRVNAPAETRLVRAQKTDIITEANLTKPTEQHFDTFDVDYEIYNDGTLEELYAQIDSVMEATGITKKEAVENLSGLS